MNQLLSDEEVNELWGDSFIGADPTSGNQRFKFTKLIEAAILAKLAGAELPEPAAWTDENFMELIVSEDIAEDIGSNVELYTADQLRQSYAQGAAAQLSAEPVGHLRKDGKHVVLSQNIESYPDFPARHPTPLYTRKEAK